MNATPVSSFLDVVGVRVLSFFFLQGALLKTYCYLCTRFNKTTL